MKPETINDRPSAIPWPPVLLAVIVAVALAIDWLLVPLPVPFAETLLVELVGALLIATGAWLIVWAVLAFRAHATTIRPDRGATVLMTTGPFAISRNPIYLGEVLMLVGAGLVFNRAALLIGAVAFAVLVTRLAIRPEEGHLARRFGDAYADYSEHVRRWV